MPSRRIPCWEGRRRSKESPRQSHGDSEPPGCPSCCSSTPAPCHSPRHPQARRGPISQQGPPRRALGPLPMQHYASQPQIRRAGASHAPEPWGSGSSGVGPRRGREPVLLLGRQRHACAAPQHPLRCGPVARATLPGLRRSITRRGCATGGDIASHSPLQPSPIPRAQNQGCPHNLPPMASPSLRPPLPFPWEQGDAHAAASAAPSQDRGFSAGGLGDGRVTKHWGHNPERGRRRRWASACKATRQHIIVGTARRQGGHTEHVTGHPKVLAGCTGGTHRHGGGAAVEPTQGLHGGLVGNWYSAQISLKIKNCSGCYSTRLAPRGAGARVRVAEALL